MSAVAAPAAVVPAPRSSSGFVDNLVVGEPVSVLVGGEGQEVWRTRSRRCEPRAWLRAVVWLVSAGLHPGAGATTVVVARDLAERMDYRRGLVMYGLEGTARRCGVSVATVKRHVKVLRELGALAWWRHGSKTNLRLPGRAYTATATVYAAVIPPVYDEAMGHRLEGSGYRARVCGVTRAGRERAVTESAARSEAHRSRKSRTGGRAAGLWGAGVPGAAPVDNSAVDNRSSQGREPHSLGRYPDVPDVDVDGGSKDTSRKRASRRNICPAPSKTSSNSDGSRRTARQTRQDIETARHVRALVNWTQGTRLRRLAFVLRPLTDAGWDAYQIAAELHSWMLTWRPARPAEYIRARLDRQATDEHQARQADLGEGWDETAASGPLRASRPGLVHNVLALLNEGLATFAERQAELGFDDLLPQTTTSHGTWTDDSTAAADVAAFLGGTA
ncbi:cell wall protein [Streptomyces sp. NPDC056053]|uniref:cell wall protein n=1 Tax=Streptomyces sp. NPDC056053 TaxID=3345696 RepID=UPI0035D55F91